MKKLFFAAALLIGCISASAQSADTKCEFGIVGGLTSSSTTLNGAWEDIKTNNLNQFHVGIAYKIPLGSFLALQPELIYNVKGTIAKLEDVKTLEWKTGFLELPVQLQWAPFGNIAGIVRPYVMAEPFIGYAVSNKYDLVTSSEAKTDWDNVKNRFEYGAGLGAGVDLFKLVQISVKYSWNFGTLYDVSWETIKQTMTSNCSGIQVTAGILF